MRTLTRCVITLLLILHLIPIVRAQSGGTLEKTSLPSTKIFAVETVPQGVLAGENDARSWLTPYNGLYLSNDLGSTWQEFALSKRGITDISYDSDLLAVSTYYHYENEIGLFLSTDRGNTFTQSGPLVSTSKTKVVGNTIYLGTYSHGLWISFDRGQSWQQALGDGSGWFGPQITALSATDDLALVATSEKVFITMDEGLNWTEVNFLTGKIISQLLIKDGLVLAGSSSPPGLFISTDGGVSWHKVESWGDYPVSSIMEFKNVYFAQRNDVSKNDYALLKSDDKGISWQEIGIDPGRKMVGNTLLFSYPSYFFLALEQDGVYKYTIPQANPAGNPFLAIPWTQQSSHELVDRITAYFDHQYPLGKYLNQKEPELVQETTLNFMGFEEETPLIFYSGHNGVDFSLPYGTEVLAPASGQARYHYCEDCGHSIKIDHGNGYETTYMHLQREGLVSVDTNEIIPVEKGDIIGKVGMTGKTSGPHLHLSVLYDRDLNGKFDDYPDGLVDPFGWHDPYNLDPWQQFSWLDANGLHHGTQSKYLWKESLQQTAKYLSSNQPEITFYNETISITSEQLEQNPFTAVVLSFIKPKMPLSQYELEYIHGTSFSVHAFDHFEEEIINLDGEATLTLDLTNLDLNNVVKDTLKIYFWNGLSKKWEPLKTVIDLTLNQATATTKHLSHFALLGERLYPQPPESVSKIEGLQEAGWFLEYPQVTLSSEDRNGLGIDKIFFTINDGLDWYVYQNPFLLEQEGIITMQFRAQDLAGNLEETQREMLKIDTKNKWKGQIRVTEGQFSIRQ